MGILDDLFDAAEKGLDKLAPSKPEGDDDIRATLAADNAKWSEEQVDSLLKLAGDSLPPVARAMVRAKLLRFAEDCYARGVNDAVKLADANT